MDIVDALSQGASMYTPSTAGIAEKEDRDTKARAKSRCMMQTPIG